jgi:hypothetical protein
MRVSPLWDRPGGYAPGRGILVTVSGGQVDLELYPLAGTSPSHCKNYTPDIGLRCPEPARVGAKANFSRSRADHRGMPEKMRVSRHPWLAVFGRAYPLGALWKPDLLKEGVLRPGGDQTAVGWLERSGQPRPSMAEASCPGAPAARAGSESLLFTLTARIQWGMPEVVWVSRRPLPAMFGRAYPSRGTLDARPAH